jgi:putative chitinase
MPERHITPALLVAVYACPPARAAAWAPHLQAACALADIHSAQRLACFLGQLGHESGRLRHTREIWGPTKAQQRYERDFGSAWSKTDPRNRLAFALGNTKAGDGRRYLGRGLIQTTGRTNPLMTTLRLRQRLGTGVPDFVATPALLELPLWAALSAGLYWRIKALNRWADAHDFSTLTRRINGGLNGLAERQALYARALGALS